MAVLRNVTTGAILATRVERLTTLVQRMIGLLARSSIGSDEGVWITPCRAIHTIGMRLAIDVMFVDRHGLVLRVEHDVKPNTVRLGCFRARSVVELGAGALSGIDVRIGHELELTESRGRSTGVEHGDLRCGELRKALERGDLER